MPSTVAEHKIQNKLISPIFIIGSNSHQRLNFGTIIDTKTHQKNPKEPLKPVKNDCFVKATPNGSRRKGTHGKTLDIHIDDKKMDIDTKVQAKDKCKKIKKNEHLYEVQGNKVEEIPSTSGIRNITLKAETLAQKSVLKASDVETDSSFGVGNTRSIETTVQESSVNGMPDACITPMSPNQMDVQCQAIKSKLQVSTDNTDNPSKDLRSTALPAADNGSDMSQYQGRLKTFANWPVKFLRPETLASNGFYYLNRGDEVRCAFCKVEIMRWEPGDDPAADHRKWAPQCPFLHSQASTSWASAAAAAASSAADGHDECGSRAPSLSTRMPGPANPKYSTFVARLHSFKDWPLSMRQKPKELADAGFFYTGQGDKTKCFYCDGGLKDWEDDDVPWEQHARWFDRCAYVQLVKGRDYVQMVMTKSCLIRDKDEVRPEPPASGETAPEDDAKSSKVHDDKLCKICFEEEMNVCFVPCGHVVACAKCALSTDKCPMCRRTFQNAVRLYFS